VGADAVAGGAAGGVGGPVGAAGCPIDPADIMTAERLMDRAAKFGRLLRPPDDERARTPCQ
jgi:hypothetical protein